MRLIHVLAGMILLCSVAMADQGADRSVFWTAEQNVTDTLAGRPIGEWADEVAAKPPATPGEAMVKILVLNRAGRIDEARDAIDQAAILNPPIPTAAANELANWLIRHERHWERALARRVFEKFPQTFTGVAYASFNHWKDDGGTDEQIEAWIADRAKANPLWADTYYDYLANHQRLKVALDPAMSVFTRERSVDHAIDYLTIAHHGQVDCSAVLSAVKPRLHEEMLDLAYFTDSPLWKAKLLEQAIATPATAEDAKRTSRRPESISQQEYLLPDPQREERLLRLTIVRDYTEAERPDLAKPHLDALAKMPGNVSAMIGPAAAGNEAMSTRLLSDEKSRAADPHYWLQRAALELARKDAKAAEAAFDKAFEVAPIDEARGGKDGRTFRSQVLMAWIRAMDMSADGYDFAWTKLEGQPKNGLMVRNTMMAFTDFRDESNSRKRHINAGDERLWSILAETKVWAHSEEQILRAMMENADFAEQEKLSDRALKLSDDADLSRLKIATFCVIAFGKPSGDGRSMGRFDPPDAAEKAGYDRLLPRLNRLYRDAPDRSDRASAAGRLLSIHLRLGQWKEAEALLPVVTDQSDFRSTQSTTSDVAECAARAGAKIDAMRIWKQVVNQDRLELGSLRALSRAGLDVEVRKFYGDLSRSEPKSIAPQIALESLGQKSY